LLPLSFSTQRLLHERQAARARARFSLVAPLGTAIFTGGPTDTRTTDTEQLDLFTSGAVSPASNGQGDVDSANGGIFVLSAPATPTTRGSRTSTTATRTGTTRATTTGAVPSAAGYPFEGAFSYDDLVAAWLECRRAKRTTAAAIAFELDLEANLTALYDTLRGGTWRPGRSVCFPIHRPKNREVWAADFPDRVVHHLLYRHIGPRFERAFIADSCACIKGRGTLYGARRLKAKLRSITRNWTRRAWYLKCDLANFFPSIKKDILSARLDAKIPEPFWHDLAHRILFHDPRPTVDLRGDQARLATIPPAKSLFHQPADHGLPIGNLPSQFGANVLLDVLDQHVKHQLRVRHYIRYVDDFILLHESPQQLNAWLADIAAFLPRELGVRLNPAKTILQPVDRGVDFVGHVIKPHRTTLRRRTLNDALNRLQTIPRADVYAAANSYLGLARQASHSHHDRARICNAVRRRGFAVNHQLTKVYP